MIAQVSASLLPKIWNMDMLKCYDAAKMNTGRVWAVWPFRWPLASELSPGSSLRVTNQCYSVKVWPDVKILFITRIQREKSTLGQSQHISPTHSLWLLIWSQSAGPVPRSPNKLCRLRTRESGVLRLVIPDFFSSRPWIPSRNSDSSELVFKRGGRNWTVAATLFHS